MAKDEVITFRLTTAERSMIGELAQLSGLPISDLARMFLVGLSALAVSSPNGVEGPTLLLPIRVEPGGAVGITDLQNWLAMIQERRRKHGRQDEA